MMAAPARTGAPIPDGKRHDRGAVAARAFDALRAFDIMFVLTGGGPANTTETLTVYAYRSLFQMLQFGFGSALGVIVFALVMAVAWIYLRVMRAQESAIA